ncbi:MAG: IPT/TIG domain-containing protein, partial [Gammaproteobacteria bacterium]
MINIKKILSFVLGVVLLYPVVMGAKICQLGDNLAGCDAALDTLQTPNFSQGPLPSANSAQNLAFTSKDLGWQWPITIGAQYSKLGNYMLQAKVAQGFNAYNAFALAMELGKSQRRYSGTYGHAFDQQQRLKVTAEYLKQNLDFNFTTGTATEWVGQAAYGAAYQYVLPKGIFNAINLSVGFSKADNKALSTITDTVAGTADYRRIAGAEDRMASAGVDLLPTKTSLLGLALNYDSVNYDTKYQTVTNQNTVGFGATASLEQLVTDVLKFKLSASSRKPYKEYQAEVDWLLPTAYGTRWEMAFTGGFTRGGTDGLSNDSRFGVNVNYSFDANPNSSKMPSYTIGSRKILGDDLVQWTSTPAVYMSQVLAVKDELMLQLSGVTPNCGSIAGGTSITIAGSNLTDNLGATSGTLPVVLVGGAQATGVAVSGSSITAVTPAHAAGAVDVTVTTPSGRSVTKSGAYTYNAGVCEFLISSGANGVGSSSGLYGLDGGGLEIDARCGNRQSLLAANGANDSPSASVTIDGVPAEVVSADGNNITFRTPHGPSETSGKMGKPLDVVIIMGGVTYTMPAAFTYYGIKAEREQASNSNDQRGAYLVTSNPVASVPIFASDIQVQLNGQIVPPSSYVNNRNSLTLQPNAAANGGLKLKAGLKGTREVSIAVTNQDPRGLQDTSATKIEDDYPSSIFQLSPVFALSGGGKEVTINGAGFTLDADGAHKVDVYWGAVDESHKLHSDEYSVDNANQITIKKVRPGTGSIDLTIHDPGDPPGGHPTMLGAFTYLDLALDHDSGTESDSIIIKAKDISTTDKVFDTNASVMFHSNDKDVAPTTTTVDPGQQQITIAVPKLEENTTYDVVVTNPTSKDTFTMLGAFKYLGKLTVTGVEPNAGFINGKRQVIVQGDNFHTKQGVITKVQFGNSKEVTVDPSNVTVKEIKVTTPDMPVAGSVDVTVTQVDGGTCTDTKSGAFTYYNTLDLDRKSGPAAGGYDVTFTPANLEDKVFDAAGNVTVLFDAKPATVDTEKSTESKLVVKVPNRDSNAPSKPVITITNNNTHDSLTLTDAFTYNDNPEIDRLSTYAGLLEGGKEVQIYSQTDKKFDPAMQAETHVYFDKAEATVKSVTADV